VLFLSIRSRRRSFRPIIVIAMAVALVAVVVAKARAESPSRTTWGLGAAGKIEPRVTPMDFHGRRKAGRGIDSSRTAR
jgi:hypothetical protein